MCEELSCMFCRHLVIFSGCSLGYFEMDDDDGIREWEEYLEQGRSCPDFAKSANNELNELEVLKARVAHLEEQLADYKSLKRLIAKAWLAQAADARILARIMPKLGFTLDVAIERCDAADEIQQQAEQLTPGPSEENEEPT